MHCVTNSALLTDRVRNTLNSKVAWACNRKCCDDWILSWHMRCSMGWFDTDAETYQLMFSFDRDDMVALLPHILAELNALPAQLILPCKRTRVRSLAAATKLATATAYAAKL